MLGLSETQRRIADFISDYSKRHRYAPSYREIQSHLGFSSLGTVYRHIQTLKRKGIVTLEKNASRSLKVVEETTSPEISVPLMGLVTAGYPVETFLQTHNILVVKNLVANPSSSYALQVNGDGFISEGILEGDLILIDAERDIDEGTTVLALAFDTQAWLGRYFAEEDGIYLRSQSGEVDPRVFDYEALEVHGVLSALIRRY